MALAFWKSGAGEAAPIVFLHGLLRNRHCFAPLFPAVLPRREIFSVDQAGHGESARLDSYRVVDHLPGLISFLENEVARPAVLYGHSMGAMLAAAIAEARPELASGVVMEDPPFHTMGRRLPGSALGAYFEAIRPHLGTGIRWAELAKAPVGERTLGQLRDATQLRFMARCLAAVAPEMLDAVVAGEWLDGYDQERVWQGLRCPALLFQSDPAAGGMLTDEDAAAVTRAGSDVALVRLADGVGHQAHWQDSGAVTRHLQAFLESLD